MEASWGTLSRFIGLGGRETCILQFDTVFGAIILFLCSQFARSFGCNENDTIQIQIRPLGEDYSLVPQARYLPPQGSPTPANSSPLLLQGCLVLIGDLAGRSVMV